MLKKSGTTLHSFRDVTRRLFIGVFAVWFGVVSALGNSAIAQSSDDDFRAPIIEHELLEFGTRGDVEPFEATVVDDNAVETVSLFYRFSGETEFTEIAMKPLASTSSYTASVDTSQTDGPVSAIEYYIRAQDSAGNLVLKGFAFQPLVRELAPPVIAKPADTQLPNAQETVADSEPQTRNGVNWLYVALGVLVLGGIAGAAGGGSSGGGDEGVIDNPCPTGCQVTLSIGTP